MSGWPQTRTIPIVTACMNSNGSPTFVCTEVTVTVEEAENGIHFDLTDVQLLKDGYEEPFVHFPADEAPPFLHAAVRQHLGLPPAVSHLIPLPVSEEH